MMKMNFIFLSLISFSSFGSIHPKLIRESVERNHPLVLSSLEEFKASEGRLKTAKGNFDTKVVGEHYRVASGMWARTFSDIMLEVPTQFNNSKIYTGYSYGFNGVFPPQYSTWSTNSGGTPRVGISTSLLRNRSIDANRGSIRINQENYLIAQGNFFLNLWNLGQLGEIAYWEWVNSHKIQKVYENLLLNAETRNEFLKSRVEKGALANIILRENEQYIAGRKRALFEASERLARASYALSLFYRDSNGRPQIPTVDETYEDYPEDMESLFNSIDLKLNPEEISQKRPEIINIKSKIKSSQVEFEVAQELLKPKMDLWGDYSKNIGNEFLDNPPQVWSFGVRIEIPIERNLGQGSISSARNMRNAAEKEFKYEKERLESEIFAIQKAITLQWQQIQQSQVERQRSQEILDAENFKFKSGRGNLFLVNLREEALANAEASLYETTFKLMTTLITYQTITKIDRPSIEESRKDRK
jgi:outer membrane protein TolC